MAGNRSARTPGDPLPALFIQCFSVSFYFRKKKSPDYDLKGRIDDVSGETDMTACITTYCIQHYRRDMLQADNSSTGCRSLIQLLYVLSLLFRKGKRGKSYYISISLKGELLRSMSKPLKGVVQDETKSRATLVHGLFLLFQLFLSQGTGDEPLYQTQPSTKVALWV